MWKCAIFQPNVYARQIIRIIFHQHSKLEILFIQKINTWSWVQISSMYTLQWDFILGMCLKHLQFSWLYKWNPVLLHKFPFPLYLGKLQNVLGSIDRIAAVKFPLMNDFRLEVVLDTSSSWSYLFVCFCNMFMISTLSLQILVVCWYMK